MPLRYYAGFLLWFNERRLTKWTDEEILQRLEKEYKNSVKALAVIRKPKFLRILRNHYNIGLTGSGIPKSCSFRYASDGTILTSQGNPMTVEAIRKRLTNHKERLRNAQSKMD